MKNNTTKYTNMEDFINSLAQESKSKVENSNDDRPIMTVADKTRNILYGLLLDNYEFYKNVITQELFYKVKDRSDKLTLLDDTGFNTIVNHVNDISIDNKVFSRSLVKELIDSDYLLMQFNPIKSYMDNLPAWDGEDHIRKFFANYKYLDISEDMFHKMTEIWFVAMVKGAYFENFNNDLVLTLFSKNQGTGKTRSTARLLPPELRSYYVQNFQLGNDMKDNQSQLATNMIINLDEYNSNTKHDKNQIKAMISQSVVKIRMPYAIFETTRPAIKSFTATTNDKQFLSDATGNRRFIVIHVEEVDNDNIDATTDYKQLYSQAFNLAKSETFKAWLDRDLINKVNDLNLEYSYESLEQDILIQAFKPATKEQIDAGQYRKYKISEMVEKIRKDNENTQFNSRLLQKEIRERFYSKYGNARKGEGQGLYYYVYDKNGEGLSSDEVPF